MFGGNPILGNLHILVPFLTPSYQKPPTLYMRWFHSSRHTQREIPDTPVGTWQRTSGQLAVFRLFENMQTIFFLLVTLLSTNIDVKKNHHLLDGLLGVAGIIDS